MKISPYPLFIFLAALTITTAKFIPTWTNCSADFQQWFPRNVTVKQNRHVKEVTTLSACGNVASAGWYTTFNHLELNGSVGADYTWNNTVPYDGIEVTGGVFCLNYTTYIPDLNETRVNVSILAIDNYGYQVGCIDILLKNKTSIYE